ncbi:MAG: 16S rRNA (cytosine(1402)-N(4))-methyltransferase [Bacteroidetes bacterium HGW-Bacteroidetes-17]|nr:MAG: 16S rRNA (cytosine(1402)-N(4))-methyltransferase [Bacteroidetes bacterium HGW-Bacteroidetes-17]
MYHNPVLLHECIEGLAINANGHYVDVTYGGGGHSKEILKNLEGGKLIAFDQDKDSIKNKVEDSKLIFIQANFKELKKHLQLFQMLPVDGILADLGVSSHQIDTAERGFSTRFDGKIDMRMDQSIETSALDVLNNYSLEELSNVFKTYGELKNAKHIAKLIVNGRAEHPFSTTVELRKTLESCMPRGKENKFLAQLYQALRIEVNDELSALKSMLEQAAEVLKPGGRLVVMSYHSLEDRLVKNFIKTGNFEGKLEKDFYGNPITLFRQISRKPVTASNEELNLNPRSRSAKLRIAEKI